MSGRASKVIGSALFTVVGAVAAATLSGGGSVHHADGACPDDMHWLVCRTAQSGTGTIDGITDAVYRTTDDMHW